MLATLDSAKFPVVGNHLSLDFVNTESWRMAFRRIC